MSKLNGLTLLRFSKLSTSFGLLVEGKVYCTAAGCNGWNLISWAKKINDSTLPIRSVVSSDLMWHLLAISGRTHTCTSRVQCICAIFGMSLIIIWLIYVLDGYNVYSALDLCWRQQKTTGTSRVLKTCSSPIASGYFLAFLRSNQKFVTRGEPAS